MEFYEFFSTGYARARERFRTAAERAGADLSCHVHPHCRGPGNEELSIDVAHFGNRNAAKQLLIVSGTHGIEGFTGSAVQLGWIAKCDSRALGADLGVVLLHGLNPWGFAFRSRANENNVDLNRNFVEDYESLSNPVYRELHDALTSGEWTEAARRTAQERIDELVDRYGDDRVFDSMSKGQYEEPDGLNYGGCGREWSNTVLERVVDEHLGGARKIGFIDWHTGIGEYAKPFFLCFHDPGSSMFERAADWWGRDALENARPHGKRRPSYQGLVIHGVERFVQGRPVCGAVIEFGTRGWYMKQMLRLDLWLRRNRSCDPETYSQLEADLFDSFCPADSRWRDAVLETGVRISCQAVEGMKRW